MEDPVKPKFLPLIPFFFKIKRLGVWLYEHHSLDVAYFISSVSMTGRKARFHTLEAVIDDDDKHYRHTSTNNNADFAKAVERAFR